VLEHAVIVRYQEGSTSEADFSGELSVVSIFDDILGGGITTLDNANIIWRFFELPAICWRFERKVIRTMVFERRAVAWFVAGCDILPSILGQSLDFFGRIYDTWLENIGKIIGDKPVADVAVYSNENTSGVNNIRLNDYSDIELLHDAIEARAAVEKA
jgi:hypothetical protein